MRAGLFRRVGRTHINYFRKVPCSPTNENMHDSVWERIECMITLLRCCRSLTSSSFNDFLVRPCFRCTIVVCFVNQISTTVINPEHWLFDRSSVFMIRPCGTKLQPLLDSVDTFTPVLLSFRQCNARTELYVHLSTCLWILSVAEDQIETIPFRVLTILPNLNVFSQTQVVPVVFAPNVNVVKRIDLELNCR